MSVELEMMNEENGRLRRHVKCLEVLVKELEAKLDALEEQKPICSTTKCSIHGECRTECETCEMVDLYLAAGAKPEVTKDVEGHPV
jgi:hypothetical protein